MARFIVGFIGVLFAFHPVFAENKLPIPKEDRKFYIDQKEHELILRLVEEPNVRSYASIPKKTADAVLAVPAMFRAELKEIEKFGSEEEFKEKKLELPGLIRDKLAPNQLACLAHIIVNAKEYFALLDAQRIAEAFHVSKQMQADLEGISRRYEDLYKELQERLASTSEVSETGDEWLEYLNQQDNFPTSEKALRPSIKELGTEKTKIFLAEDLFQRANRSMGQLLSDKQKSEFKRLLASPGLRGAKKFDFAKNYVRPPKH